MKPNFSDITTFSHQIAVTFAYQSPYEVMALRCAIQSLQMDNPVVVNIGAGTGTSSLAFRETKPNAVIYTVDISAGGPHGGLENERNAFRRAGYHPPIQILGDSQQTGKDWDKGDIDLLFIDADHSYEGCKGDFEAWGKYVRPGGLIVFHDYDRDEWPDVKNVVDNIVLKEYDLVIQVDTVMVVRRPIGRKKRQ